MQRLAGTSERGESEDDQGCYLSGKRSTEVVGERRIKERGRDEYFSLFQKRKKNYQKIPIFAGKDLIVRN